MKHNIKQLIKRIRSLKACVFIRLRKIGKFGGFSARIRHSVKE